jgi:tripartite-type tricarboxylate transporter receptor subunit TctC
MMFVVAQAAVPYVQSGKLRALATTSKIRSAALPDVPTMSETGYPQIDMVGWNGVSVPIRTSKPLINKLNSDIRQVLGDKTLQQRMINAGFELADTRIDEFAGFINKDVTTYGRIIRDAKVRLN